MACQRRHFLPKTLLTLRPFDVPRWRGSCCCSFPSRVSFFFIPPSVVSFFFVFGKTRKEINFFLPPFCMGKLLYVHVRRRRIINRHIQFDSFIRFIRAKGLVVSNNKRRCIPAPPRLRHRPPLSSGGGTTRRLRTPPPSATKLEAPTKVDDATFNDDIERKPPPKKMTTSSSR